MAVRELSSSDCLASPDPRGKAPHDGHAEPGVRTASLGSASGSTAPKRVTGKNTWSMASVPPHAFFSGMLKVKPASRAVPLQSLPHAALPFGHLSCPQLRRSSPPPPPPRVSGAAFYRAPGARAWTSDGPAAGTAQEGGAGGHGDRRAMEPILAAADTGRETPEAPRRAAPRLLRGNLGIPCASSRGKPAGSTCTVRRPSPELSPRHRAPARARASGSPWPPGAGGAAVGAALCW